MYFVCFLKIWKDLEKAVYVKLLFQRVLILKDRIDFLL
jgi:hypothetical protein